MNSFIFFFARLRDDFFPVILPEKRTWNPLAIDGNGLHFSLKKCVSESNRVCRLVCCSRIILSDEWTNGSTWRWSKMNLDKILSPSLFNISPCFGSTRAKCRIAETVTNSWIAAHQKKMSIYDQVFVMHALRLGDGCCSLRSFFSCTNFASIFPPHIGQPIDDVAGWGVNVLNMN